MNIHQVSNIFTFILCLSIHSRDAISEENQNINTELLSPANDSNGLFSIEGGRVMEKGRGYFTIFLNYSQNPLILKRVSSEGFEESENLITARMMGNLLTSYSITRFYEMGIDLPILFYQSSHASSTETIQPISRAGCGDMRVIPKVQIFREGDRPLSLSMVLPLSFPSGVDKSFIGESSVVWSPVFAIEKGVGVVRLIANTGARFRKETELAGIDIGNEFLLKFGAKGEVMKKLSLMGELSSNLGGDISEENPVELLAGASYLLPYDLKVDMGFGAGLTDGYGTPSFRFLVSLSYNPVMRIRPRDRDRDLIPDKFDTYPCEAEDEDGYRDNDGCPDPDNDMDNMIDTDDKCPDLVEDMEGCEDEDGCPDPDNDEDGIEDSREKCPDEAEDKDEFEDEDGWPEENTPSLTRLMEDTIEITQMIHFNFGKSTIKEESLLVLDSILDIMLEQPQIKKISVDVPTDSIGNDDNNIKLYEQRAKAVVDYMIAKGIDKSRLIYKGFGSTKPDNTNNTLEGRRGKSNVRIHHCPTIVC